MDEIVKKALGKWPDVPDVFGWLRLDRRGRWLLQARPGEFEPIGNAALNDFISRNYQPDERGRWYFQNGPQRVFATLEATPWIYRLDDHAHGWIAHTGAKAGAPSELLFDQQGGIVLVTPLGPGLVLDRDTAALLDALEDEQGKPVDAEALIATVRGGQRMGVKLLDSPVTAAMMQGSLASRFGFDPDPAA